MTCKRCLVAIAIATLAFPVWAESADTARQNDTSRETAAGEPDVMSTSTRTARHGSSFTTSHIGFQGWGLRAGVANDIDQVLGGAHFNMGEFMPNLRFQPDLQLGAGDDHTTLYGTAPVYYRFGTEARFTPYAGGGVSLGFVDRDLPPGSNADDSEFEVGGKVTGGLEWPRPEGQAFFVELSLGFGDIHDATLMAAWSF